MSAQEYYNDFPSATSPIFQLFSSAFGHGDNSGEEVFVGSEAAERGQSVSGECLCILSAVRALPFSSFSFICPFARQTDHVFDNEHNAAWWSLCPEVCTRDTSFERRSV